MDTKETKKSGIEKEPPRKEAGAETEGKEGLKELLSKQGEAVDSSVENLKAGGEKDIEAVKKVGGREDVEEIRDGVEKIGQEAEGAKDIYEKEAIEAKRGLKTEKEIMEEVGKINEKIDEAIRKGLHKKEQELRKERERFLDLLDLDNKYGDIGSGTGQETEITKEKSAEKITEKGKIKTPDIKKEGLEKEDLKKIEEIIKGAEAEMEFLKISTLTKEEKIKSLDEQLGLLEEILPKFNNAKPNESVLFRKANGLSKRMRNLKENPWLLGA